MTDDVAVTGERRPFASSLPAGDGHKPGPLSDPTAAANGVSSLPAPVELTEHQAATSSPIHSVAGAIMRRSMRLVDLFENCPDALDVLADILLAANAFMKATGAKGADLRIEVTSKLVRAGGAMQHVTRMVALDDYDEPVEEMDIVTRFDRRK